MTTPAREIGPRPHRKNKTMIEPNSRPFDFATYLRTASTLPLMGLEVSEITKEKDTVLRILPSASTIEPYALSLVEQCGGEDLDVIEERRAADVPMVFREVFDLGREWGHDEGYSDHKTKVARLTVETTKLDDAPEVTPEEGESRRVVAIQTVGGVVGLSVVATVDGKDDLRDIKEAQNANDAVRVAYEMGRAAKTAADRRRGAALREIEALPVGGVYIEERPEWSNLFVPDCSIEGGRYATHSHRVRVERRENRPDGTASYEIRAEVDVHRGEGWTGFDFGMGIPRHENEMEAYGGAFSIKHWYAAFVSMIEAEAAEMRHSEDARAEREKWGITDEHLRTGTLSEATKARLEAEAGK